MKWLPIILWLLVICYLSFTPLTALPQINVSAIDKIAHFMLYAILELLLWWCLSSNRGVFKLATSLAFLFSAATELIQHYFIPFRYGDIYDFVANILGLGLVYLIVKNRLKAN